MTDRDHQSTDRRQEALNGRPKEPPQGRPEDASVRVFVSSTFRDMHGERDVLVRDVFPALRARLRARGVELFEVDLRWGVTEAQAERGETLPTLFAEVDRCRPYFIGLLGERYGWIPEDDILTPALRAAYPAVADLAGRSVTEMEIVHGVLSDPDAAAHAFFFERDPAWSRAQEQAGGGRDGDADESGDFIEADPAAQEKLNALKARVRASGAPVIAYGSPAAIGEAVTAAFGAALEARFPDLAAPDPHVEAARLHEAYARERRGLHIGGAGAMAQLDAWLADDGAPPMLITGASGGGKSALIANWMAAQRAARPQALVFEHYLGASPDSADPTRLMMRLWEHLDRATGDDATPPPNAAPLIELAAGLEERLARAAAAQPDGAPILLAFDGLDKLLSEQNLRWVPALRAPNLKLIASALDGPAKDAGLARGWRPLNVAPLSADERREFLQATLAQWGRALAERHAAPVLAHPLAGAPLFLKTVLEELRASAVHDRLDERLAHYLAATDMPDLFARMLARLEDDAGDPAPVREALSLVWAGRSGLEETEILAIAGTAPLDWARLRNGLGDALRDQLGRVAFSHDYLRNAVAARYLVDEETRRRAHRRIADRFAARAPDARQAEELPHQLREAHAWADLETVLLDLDRFESLRGRGDAELFSHWLALRDHSETRETALCGAFLAERREQAQEGAQGQARGQAQRDAWDDDAIARAFSLSHFLHFAGGDAEALQALIEALVAACEQARGPDAPSTLTAQNDLAAALKARGDLGGAQALEERVLDARSRRLGPEHPHTLLSVNNLAATLDARGDLPAARRLHERAAEASARTLGVAHPETLTSASNLATTLHALGELDAAREMAEDVLAVRRRVLGPDHRDTLTSLNNLASTLEALGALEEAQTLQEEVTAANTRLLGPDHPNTLTSRTNLAQTLLARGDADGAQAEEEAVLTIRRSRLGDTHPDTLKSVGGLAAVLAARGDYSAAQRLQRRVHEASVRLLGEAHPDSMAALNNLAHSRRASGDLDGARTLQERLIETMRGCLGEAHPNTLSARENLAGTRYHQGDYAGARRELEAVLETRRGLFGPEHPAVLSNMGNVAGVLYAEGAFDAAVALQLQALDASRRVLGEAHPETLKCLNNLAAFHGARGEYQAARAHLEEAYAARAETLGRGHPDTLASLGNLAQMLKELGELDQAQRYQEEALEGETRLFGPEHPSRLIAASNLALIHYDRRDFARAQALQEEVFSVRERVLGAEHPSTLLAKGNLATTLMARGEVAAAVRLLEQVVEAESRLLGPEHPSTLSSLGNLASAYFSAGDLDVAEDLQRRVSYESARVLGPDHPHARIAADNLAATRRAIAARGDNA